jgi:ribulose-phosphate 3-epimerase
MITTICPTITASNADEYKNQIERVSRFAVRIHIDLADGQLAPTKLVPIDQVWWPGGMRADLHVMYQRPFEHTKLLLDLRPQLIIVHAEGEGDFVKFAEEAHRQGVEVGVALKPATATSLIRPALQWIDHVLIFSGNLGHFGGQADLNLLSKVKELRAMKPQLEIGWDGGINEQNARALAEGGVDVLNVGGYVHHSSNPGAAFQALKTVIGA